MVEELTKPFCVSLDSLRFLQNYVKRPTVEAKRWVEHLKGEWGEDWRNHRFDLKRDVSQRVIDQLAFVDLHLPLEVEKRGEFYIVNNGTHTAYSYWLRKRKEILVKVSNQVLYRNKRLYTFEEIRVED